MGFPCLYGFDCMNPMGTGPEPEFNQLQVEDSSQIFMVGTLGNWLNTVPLKSLHTRKRVQLSSCKKVLQPMCHSMKAKHFTDLFRLYPPWMVLFSISSTSVLFYI